MEAQEPIRAGQFVACLAVVVHFLFLGRECSNRAHIGNHLMIPCLYIVWGARALFCGFFFYLSRHTARTAIQPLCISTQFPQVGSVDIQQDV